MALSGTIRTNAWVGDNEWRLACVWSATQNIANNTSTISWQLKVDSTASSGNWVTYGEMRLTFGGEVIYYRSYDTTSNGHPGDILASGTKTITHNTDGSKSIAVTVEAGIYNWAINKSGSGTITLDTIPRAATLTVAPNFNDEANPTIYYRNLAGNAVTALDACISFTGANPDIDYRAVSKTSEEYTFNLTDAERNTLRAQAANSNSITVYFYLRTKIGEQFYFSSLQKTMTIVNATPTLNPEVTRQGQAANFATTGTNNIIRYAHNASYSFNATALKGASIASYRVTNGSQSQTASSGKITSIDSGDFVFTVTDSRGNSATKTVSFTLIPYIPFTCNIKARMDTEGEMTVEMWGNAYNGEFRSGYGNDIAVGNVLWLSSDGGSTYEDVLDETETVTRNNDHTYTIVTKFSIVDSDTGDQPLDYRKQYVLKVNIQDQFSGLITKILTVRSYPVFDWGESDFAFNVPISIEGNNLADFIVEQGTESMGSNGTWYWFKYASGRAECYGIRNYGVMSASTAFGGLFKSPDYTQSYPSGLFSAAPGVTINLTQTGNYLGWIAQGGTGSTSATPTFCVVRPASTNFSSSYLAFHAIGRWK